MIFFYTPIQCLWAPGKSSGVPSSPVLYPSNAFPCLHPSEARFTTYEAFRCRIQNENKNRKLTFSSPLDSLRQLHRHCFFHHSKGGRKLGG